MENPTTIIFVEDNPSDLRLFEYALSQLETSVNLLHFEHGQAFLDKLPELYPAAIACILLDINTPFVNGFEVLESLRQNSDYQYLPIIAFTSSNSVEEKLKFYQLGGNAYVSKPLEIDELVAAVSHIVGFWVHTNLRAS
ncbi:MAG: response regulator [Bacteroidetes bacterium]|nr:MAG: response regulator [Bacteroidota bacterium]